jgi:hypothetical protein
MRRDIDPIKIIQILPFSNRPEKPPQEPSPLSELLKKAFRAAREASARLLTTIQGHLARLRPVSSELYEKLKFRTHAQKTEESSVREPVSQSDMKPLDDFSTHLEEPSLDLQHHTPNTPKTGSIWFISARQWVVAAWPSRRARLDVIKGKLAAGALEWRGKIRKTWGTQESWRIKTEQVVRPLTSAVRSLRRRHQHLVDQLNSTHSIVQSQQQEITELAFQLASIKTEVTAHKKTIEELAHQVKSLQTKVAQTLPATHGTTGQSGPPAQGRRGTTATKRNGPSETGPQSKAEH